MAFFVVVYDLLFNATASRSIFPFRTKFFNVCFGFYSSSSTIHAKALPFSPKIRWDYLDKSFKWLNRAYSTINKHFSCIFSAIRFFLSFQVLFDFIRWYAVLKIRHKPDFHSLCLVFTSKHCNFGPNSIWIEWTPWYAFVSMVNTVEIMTIKTNRTRTYIKSVFFCLIQNLRSWIIENKLNFSYFQKENTKLKVLISFIAFRR